MRAIYCWVLQHSAIAAMTPRGDFRDWSFDAEWSTHFLRREGLQGKSVEISTAGSGAEAFCDLKYTRSSCVQSATRRTDSRRQNTKCTLQLGASIPWLEKHLKKMLTYKLSADFLNIMVSRPSIRHHTGETAWQSHAAQGET